MSQLRAILVLLGLWLSPLNLPPGIFPAPTTTTTTTSTSTTSTTLPPTTTSTTIRVVVPDDDIWWALALCEDGGRNRVYGEYHGYFHFALSTWRGVGGPGNPEDHDYETQKFYAQKLQAREGWWPWPGCKVKLGL